MDIGTIIAIALAVLAGLAFIGLLIWAIIVFAALRVAKRAASRLDLSPFGIDPDIRSTSIRQQHERVKRWGLDS